MEPYLQRSLRKNYEALTSAECARLAIEYIRQKESVFDEEVADLRNLIKVYGQHVLQQYPSWVDLPVLEKSHSLAREAIEKVEQEEQRRTLYDINKGHLFSHLGDIDKELFARTRGESWAKEWYENKIAATELERNIHPKHSAYILGETGVAASALYSLTAEPFWAEQSFKRNRQCAEYFSLSNPAHAMNQFCFAGYSAERVFQQTRERRWAERARECYGQALELRENIPLVQRTRYAKAADERLSSLCIQLAMVPEGVEEL